MYEKYLVVRLAHISPNRHFPACFLLPVSNPNRGIECIRNLCSANMRNLNFVLLTSPSWGTSVEIKACLCP